MTKKEIKVRRKKALFSLLAFAIFFLFTMISTTHTPPDILVYAFGTGCVGYVGYQWLYEIWKTVAETDSAGRISRIIWLFIIGFVGAWIFPFFLRSNQKGP